MSRQGLKVAKREPSRGATDSAAKHCKASHQTLQFLTRN